VPTGHELGCSALQHPKSSAKLPEVPLNLQFEALVDMLAGALPLSSPLTC